MIDSSSIPLILKSHENIIPFFTCLNQMKNWAFVAVIAGVAVVWYVLKTREGFVAEFTDRSPEEKTDKTRVSHYTQETNHFKMMPSQDLPPLGGIETPYRVNAYNSFVPV
jgi:hypothetical protein